MLAMSARTQFEELLEPVLPAAYRAALNMARNRDDADDLIQDAVVLAFKAMHSFQAGTNFKAWFFRILTNRFYQRFRKQQRQPEIASTEEAPDLYLYTRTSEAGLHAQSSDPATLLMARLDQQQVLAAIESLPDEFRVVSALYFVEEFSYPEIAEVLECPIGTVRSRLHRGRKLLQKALWRVAEERGVVESLRAEAV
jgi:RNA polymerase sigma-70 factor (ECF subfamily)